MRSKHPRFVKCYLNLGRLFDPAEMLFILHMQQVEFLCQASQGGRWSKKFLMKKMGLGEKVFDRCVRRLEQMELLIVSSDYHPVYRWDTALYERLVEILSATDNLEALDGFCRRMFLEEKRCIRGISDFEVEMLGKSALSRRKGGTDHSQKKVI